MPLWQGKSNASPLGYRIFVSILKNWGVSPAYLLLRFVALYYFLFSRKSSMPVFFLYYHKLSYSWLASLLKVYKNYYMFGQSLIDRVVVMAEIPNKFTFDFDGEIYLREMASQKKGGILLSAHIGNWEIAGHLLKRLNTKINIVMFDEEHKKIKQYLDSVKGKKTMKVITIKENLSHIYEINDALKNNELVCMHADRFLPANKTFTEIFLGSVARFPVGPFLLAAQFKVPVSLTFAMKESGNHYHFSATKPKEYDLSSKEKFMRELLKDFTGEMEKKLKQHPEQWYNYYDFWKQQS
ncbi:MAG: lipid A biosynthesis acyltransferase [Bacteroidetes bacterium]|nr:lipid A biosynthesis acyltransferase [Bacteroidota bacterium]